METRRTEPTSAVTPEAGPPGRPDRDAPPREFVAYDQRVFRFARVSAVAACDALAGLFEAVASDDRAAGLAAAAYVADGPETGRDEPHRWLDDAIAHVGPAFDRFARPTTWGRFAPSTPLADRVFDDDPTPESAHHAVSDALLRIRSLLTVRHLRERAEPPGRGLTVPEIVAAHVTGAELDWGLVRESLAGGDGGFYRELAALVRRESVRAAADARADAERFLGLRVTARRRRIRPVLPTDPDPT